MSPERRATYRLQLNPEFGLDDAAGLADYLASLGASHLYSSPILQAAPGSRHGYDVVNPQQVSEQLGGEEARRRLIAALARQRLALLLDIVPNHMAITLPENPWWWDVLENGPASRYADFFDVEWNPPEARNANQILLPVLGDHYGRVLEAGEITLEQGEDGFRICYYDHAFPVDPVSLAVVLDRAAARSGSEKLSFLAAGLAQLPAAALTDPASTERRYQDQSVLWEFLNYTLEQEPESALAIGDVVKAINSNPDALHNLLGVQNYRLAFWRISDQELGYRRFFNINNLIGLRVEEEKVFQESHKLIVRWIETGQVDGLRIDHPDGLRDPEGYLRRLRQAAPATWILVEKILEEGEPLPHEWPVAGTTGYDFLNQVNGLFIDQAGEKPLTDFYARFTGESSDYEEVVYEKKMLVMDTILGSDVERLAGLLLELCEQYPRYRDTTRSELRTAVRAIAASMPVYRTYIRAESEEQVTVRQGIPLAFALERAKAQTPELDASLFDFIYDLLLLEVQSAQTAEFVARFQQFTGPVMAKGAEDTAFYCYNLLVSVNEVGGDPGRFGFCPHEFHEACTDRQLFWPYAGLATSTHDTKRSEDVRARLNVLSEIPEQWAEAVEQWAVRADQYRSNGSPDANDEYLLYQTLVGAWPISQERVLQYMEKAVREAKRHTSWTRPDEAYEAAVATFIRGVMDDRQLVAGLEALVEQIKGPGRVNSLSQTLLKLTTPGIPDIYQGTELWDLSLVDPDNRRPVDFAQRRQLLAWLEEDRSPEAIMARMDEGLPKLWLTYRTLLLRASQPGLFGAEAEYRPLPVQGGDPALAFTRGDKVAVVVPRLLLSQPEWKKASVSLPGRSWQNLFTGEHLEGGEHRLERLFARFPVALLVSPEAADRAS